MSTAASIVDRPTTFSRRRLLGGAVGVGAILASGRVPAAAAQNASPAASPVASGGTTANWTKFNLNTITSDQIVTIPSAGNQMKREFAEYRPWTSVKQFQTEIGKFVDASVVNGYRQFVFVPVDVTKADADRPVTSRSRGARRPGRALNRPIRPEWQQRCGS